MDVLQVCVCDWHIWSGWSNACHHLVRPGCPASEDVTAHLHVLLLPIQACGLQCEVNGKEERVRRAQRGQQESLVAPPR